MTQTLHRLPGWPERLADYLAAHLHTSFAWGSHDCVRFAAGAVRAVTGLDVLPVQWASRAAAVQALRQHGGLVAAVDGVLPRLPATAQAWRGDVVLVQAPDGAVVRRWLAVCDSGRWWAPARGGLSCGPMAEAVAAWGVAHG